MKKVLNKIIIIIIPILILFLAIYSRGQKANSLDNILIFNLYENSQNRNYTFDISTKNKQTIQANLNNTLKIDSLANQKIAPGARGEFTITLTSSKNVYYKIEFEDLNNKPQNLKFRIKNSTSKYNNLEELEKYLIDNLSKNCTKEIFIEWSWEYETSEIDNKQDTIDGINLEKYKFNINVISEEI